jgi:hypothetical protein
VIVNGYVAGAIAADVVTVSVEVPAPVIVAGAKLHVACDGERPATESETPPANPLNALVATVYETALPGSVLAEDGVAATAKSGGGETFSVAWDVRVVDPLVPVTVRS